LVVDADGFVQEAQKPCSGRDEMCNEVLNDKWASHPTWASEDSGFVAHKKNQYEDILHRIEEERHDYDFNIEANLRTIQLLEPIAQRIAGMTQEEKNNFRVAPGLGGQSKTIYQRVIKKVWGKENGLEIIDRLHNDPTRTVPLVLSRLKKKDEEWKAAQREWQKVWRDQTARVFWKSLDHQGISIKQNDKKQFQIKTLVAEITAKRDEQLSKKLSASTPDPEYQFQYEFKDPNIILDISRLLAVALENSNAFSNNDREKIDGFIKSFVPLFFGMNSRDVEDTVNSVTRRGVDDDDDGSVFAGEGSSRSARRKHDVDLLLHVLTRGKGKNTRKDKDSIASVANSRDSSQEPHDGDVEMTSPTSSEPRTKEEGNWIAKPTKHLTGTKHSFPMSPIEQQEPVVHKRTVFSLYCNATIYGFFRSFQILYDRLSSVKASEDQIRADVERRKKYKVAHDLNIMTQRVEDIFAETGPNANYYSQILDMCEKVLEGELDTAGFEEGLRNVFVQGGWKLYTIEKSCISILKFIQSIVPSEGKEKNMEKEKTAEVVLRFQKDRQRRTYEKEGGEYRELIAYRRAVEAILGPNEELYRIDWVCPPLPSRAKECRLMEIERTRAESLDPHRPPRHAHHHRVSG
jgi:paired amphipathic helix protein Sin3a